MNNDDVGTVPISCRIEQHHNDLLERLARNKSIPKGTLVSNIVENHLDFYNAVESSGNIPISKTVIRLFCKDITDDTIKDIVEFVTAEILTFHKMKFKSPTFENTMGSIERWLAFNKFKFNHETHGNTVKFFGQHDLGRNWSRICIGICTKLFESSGNKVRPIDVDEISFTFDVIL